MKNKLKILKTTLIFLIFNTIISYIISFNFLKFTGAIEGFIDFSYLTFVTISHLALLTHGLLLFIIPIIFVIPIKKTIKYITIILSIAFIFALYADSIAFEQYRFHINKFIFNLIIKGGKGVFHFQKIMYIIFITIFLTIAISEFFIYKLAEKLSLLKINKQLKYLYITIGILFITTNIMYAFASALYYNPITKHSRVYPLYFPLTANTFLRKHFVDEDKARTHLEQTKISNTDITYPKNELRFDSITNKKNIIFLCIDSWRADCLSKSITPNIWKLKTNSSTFSNHFSGSNGTRGGIFSIFYALPSIYWENMKANCISPVFLNTLQNNDYEFGIFSTATLLAPAFDKTVFSRIKNINLKTKGKKPSEGDSIITKQFTNFIEKHNNKKPFFGFLFYDSAHGYDYPKDYNIKFKPSLDAVNYLKLNNNYDRTAFFNRYKNAVNYIDYQIAKIINKLKEKNILENTIIVITGDHSQEFNDNKKNYWGHNGNFSQYQIKTPLIIFDTDEKTKEYKHKTSHYDIIPTLMHKYLKCLNPSKDFSIGKNLFEIKDWKHHISGSYMNFGIISDNKIITKYINGDFTVTDLKLNELSTDSINYSKLSTIITNLNYFYKKQIHL